MRLGYRVRVDLRTRTERLAYWTGLYDDWLIRSAARYLCSRPGAVALDVGANIGFWTLGLVAASGGNCHIHAFEPVPCNYRRLEENLSLNTNLWGARATAHPFGLSDGDTQVEVSLREDFEAGADTGNAAVVIDHSDRRFRCLWVQMRKLDSLVGELGLGRLDLIKLDIEGHEDRAFAGAAETIARFRPLILTEINEPYYERRGLDATCVFRDWMSRNDYVAAVACGRSWVVAALERRKRGLDNVLLLPAEFRQEIIALVN
jgi:FkbM family methyltransferase